MLIRTPAKLNIGLNITGIREDGYHLLDTVMQTVDIYDRLEITPREDNEIVIWCSDPRVPTDEHNLVYKAVRALTGKGLDIKIYKRIPMEAGMGGGSSDAAAALKAVNEMFSLNKTEDELEKIAVRLGADVPFFIKGGRQRCRGIGEDMEVLNNIDAYYVVIKPMVSISTKEVYAGYDRLKPELREDIINVLEPVTAEKYPVITEIRRKLEFHGAILTSMTGSGTAVFGEFDSLEGAKKCAEKTGGMVCQTC